MSKNVVNLILYLCAVFCITLVAIIPILIESKSSATTGVIPWNNSGNTNNLGNSDSGNGGDIGNLENSNNDTFTFLPRENSTSLNAITINVNESFNLMDFVLTNVPEQIISVKTNSDKITVGNTVPYNVVGILGGEAEIVIEIILNGTSMQFEFHVTLIVPEPISIDEYELSAKNLGFGYWQIILLKNGEQIDYNIAELYYDKSRAIPDTNYIFLIIGTENITFCLVNLEISCILEP